MSDSLSIDQLLWGPLIFLVLAACIWGWRRALRRWAAGRSLLEYEPRQEVPWGLAHLILTFVLFAAIQNAVFTILGRWGIEPGMPLAERPASDRAAVLLAAALSTLGGLVLSLPLIGYHTGASWRDFGWNAQRWAADVRLGAITFAMIAPIVYAIHFVLVQWFESKHPLLELLREHPDPAFFVISGFSAVIVAPVVEEYFFRVLLQGWLERLASSARGKMTPLILGGKGDGGAAASSEERENSEEKELAPVDPNPFSPPYRDAERQAAVEPGAKQYPSSWPIFVSAGFFAMVHFTHGPDPVALFVLAIALGYLYQRTHRILPCIVVHCLLNACSLLVLWFAVYFGAD